MSVAAHDRSRPGLILPLALAISSASAILLAVYPGFMSYDSLRALRDARGSVGGGTYPPFVSYVWRVFDWIWPGPALMRRKALARAAAIAVYASGVLYLSPFFFISPDADVRYDHWSLVCVFIVMALAAAPSRAGAERTARVESSA